MAMKVEIISKVSVKPSSPTPPELRELKLSFLDQSAPANYTPLLFFYPADQLHGSTLDADRLHRCHKLKKSLAETLSRYYLLAGTLVEDYLVDCNDGGVEFSEARLFCKLSEVMEKPDVKVLHQLLPFDLDPSRLAEFGSSSRDCILAVRYNVFECGGLAVALCITHKVVDGTSATSFAKDWAAACRGVTEFTPLSFDAAKLFPPVEFPGEKRQARMRKTVTRRFVFRKPDIAALKKRMNSDVLPGRPPSRVEVVSAFIWERFMVIARSRENTAKRFKAFHAVNLRGRTEPPLPAQSFGNVWWLAVAEAPVKEEKNYPFLVAQIRKAIKEIDSDYVKSLQDVENTMKLKMKTGQLVNSGEEEFCGFTSWCGFPVYDVDFGWGKPAWVCSPGRPYKNLVVLENTSDGEGIEAWVNLEEKDAPFFEIDPELLSFTSN